MPKSTDLVGQIFGYLEIIGSNPGSRKERKTWNCECRCGAITKVATGDLKSGHTTSCGCKKFESLIVNITHGAFVGGNGPSPEYTAWRNMFVRCEELNEIYYEAYAKRGITICERWNKFENFYQDMGPKPSAEHSLDRSDNDKGYYKENCRWATAKEQANNTRRNVWIVWEDKRRTISQWANYWNIDPDRLRRLLFKHGII